MLRWVFFAILIFVGTVASQEPTSQPTETSSITIHVVQRDETLSQIALRYGTTIGDITTVNSLLNPDNLQIGQRLIIPGTQSALPGMIVTHTVQPGETLNTIAIRYNSTIESLSLVNKISSTGPLYVGQSLLVTKGAAGTLPPDSLSLHIVQPNENLMRISAHYQIPMQRLAEANHLEFNAPLQAGQMLILPDSDAASNFVSLPQPITGFQLGPLPAVQGKTLSAFIVARAGLTVTGQIFDREITFSPVNNGYTAMIGIHAFTVPGIYKFTLTLTDEAGLSMTYPARIKIENGGYSSEAINVPPEQENLLAPEVVQAELERVTAVMSGFTSVPAFNGLMGLPSTGRVTSQFGTRRSYNGSAYNTFHGGADFGGLPGSLILAPADGVIVLAEPLNVRGNAVIIDHGIGVYTGYWHQSAIYVQTGQKVTKGDVLGTVGSTGLSTGAHLHWEMWVGGVQVDPLQWLTYPFTPEG
ncbi:MAG: LysM peptidoglycan-binding domain-containing protein [Anaerolineae bacterium]|nr:LysM peptidoglycan-binding domain-containing protein [Anaerolineae bacterium]